MATTKRGGARPGSGRKAGEANKKTREIADKAAKEGITPLEVMLKTMNALMERADQAKSLKVVPGEKKVVSYLDLMVEAASVAKDAAPYMHPRLQAVEVSGPNGGPIQQESVTHDELAAAVRNVRDKF